MNIFKHVISWDQFQLSDIEKILETAEFIENNLESEKVKNLLNWKVMASLFYEPSTRTRLSFETAAHRLWASVITVSDMDSSSMKKWETLEDTLNVVQQYADFIVMRHPESWAAKRASNILNIPFLNAWDWAWEHPTQAILDTYTIKKEQWKLSWLKIALVWDLKFWRTVHSLVKVLKHFDNEFYFVAPESLKMPEEYCNWLNWNCKINFSDNLKEVIDEVDVVYMTRVQEERFDDKSEYEKLKDVFTLSIEDLDNAKKSITIMHPLPRVWELHESVDSHPWWACFRQVKNWVYARMALISLAMWHDFI